MNNSRTYNNISNENLLLVNILNDMYNDNIRQINNLQQSINAHNDANTQIRNLLVQILYSPASQQNSNMFTHRTTPRINNYINNNARQPDIRNIPLNNTPYIIDNAQRYGIPRSRNEQNSITRLLESFFLPVNIYPTQSQIENATRVVRYSDITSPINRSCPISLENFNEDDMVTVIRFCSHVFNSNELNRWFQTNCRCPVCRYDIRNYTPNTPSNLYRDRDINNQNTNRYLQQETENTSSQTNEERIQTTTSMGTGPSVFFDIIVDNFSEDDGTSDI